MSATITPKVISFQNDLAYDILVYDSTFPDSGTDDDSNYFGDLTMLGTVTASSTGSIQPIYSTSTFIVESSSDSKPIKRCIKMASERDVTSFTVQQTDEDAMTSTFQFIDFILKNPDDAISTSFKALWKDTSADLAQAVDGFFSRQPGYTHCGFEDYMMGITYHAQNPDPVPTTTGTTGSGSIVKPKPETTYSLSKLIALTGGTWPDGLPDIAVSGFSCKFRDKQLIILMKIDISQLPFESPLIAQNINSLFGDKKLTVSLQINFSVSPGIFGTRLSILPDTFKIPVGNGQSVAITKPSITFDINPLFKFVVFTLRGYIPFNISGSALNANISMTIDNIEAAIGAVIEGDNNPLPAPPVMKGVHFDQVGVGMGVFFAPPGFAMGLEGKFHIGTPDGKNVVELNDDTFALVCKINGEVPEPVYISFYVPKMDINEVVEIFTNKSPNINVPVTFTDLSFKWAENPMEPVVLPDGTLSQMAYGFSAAINVFSFGFYGDVAIDMDNGLTAHVEMSPVTIPDVFKLSGDGKGVTIKVDQNGNPIRNNEIRNKQVLQDALRQAKDHQLVAPGGPVLIINTFKSPVLHISGKVSLFELSEYAIEADINKDGIWFQLDFGGLLTEQMACKLSDYHNLYGGFSYGLNRTVSLNAIDGYSLGSFTLQAMVNVHLSITTSLSDIVISVGGSFDFEGITRSFGDFSADVHIRKMADLLEAIFNNIQENVRQIFGDLVNDAGAWASKAKAGILYGTSHVSNVLHYSFNKSSSEVASIMKRVGYSASEVASGIKDTFKISVDDVASVMKSVGYGASEVGNAFKSLGGDFEDVGKKVLDKVNPLNW